MELREQAEIQFGKRVRDERERRGWSQEELAKRLTDRGIEGMHSSTIAKIESSRKPRAVRLAEASAIAELFEVSLDVLLGRSAIPDRDAVYTLRGVHSTARQVSGQLTTAASSIGERVSDLALLEFEGCDALQSDLLSVTKLLAQAAVRLREIQDFELPPDMAVKVHGVLVDRAAREMIERQARESLQKEANTDETQS